MTEVLPIQVQHFLDKDPEDLKKFLQSVSSNKLSEFLVGIKETLIKFPKSASLLKLEQYFLDELMNRDRSIAKIHIDEVKDTTNNLATVINDNNLMAMEFPEEQWLIEKIVPESGITMFVGEAAAGKSFIALDAARSVLTGNKFWPRQAR